MPKGVYPRRVKRHAVIQPLETDYRFIPLTRNQNAIVDAADFEWLSQWNWYAMWSKCTKSFYAARRGPCSSVIFMHRLIIDSEKLVDHKDHNTLDNRRENLRKCTYMQNSQNKRMRRNNRSGFKGVRWEESIRK